MGADYKPGTVAKATVRGVPDVTMFCTTNSLIGGTEWALDRRIKRREDDGYGSGFATSDEVTDVRPLVVLDFTPSPAHLPQLLRLLRDNFWPDLAGQIEAQTKPPRIDEPGLWGVVEATVPGIPRRRWVHHEEGRWVPDTGIPFKDWSDLIDPVLIREGVES